MRRAAWAIKNAWFRTRMAYQRARYGFSDDQFWSLDYTIARIVVEGTQRLRDRGYGIPLQFTKEHGDGTEWDGWDAVLAQIQDGFQAFLDENGWMRDESRERLQKSGALLMEHFESLWD